MLKLPTCLAMLIAAVSNNTIVVASAVCLISMFLTIDDRLASGRWRWDFITVSVGTLAIFAALCLLP